MGSVGSKIKHGFEDVGDDIKHGVEDAGKAVAHEAEDVYDVGKNIVHGNFKGAIDDVGDMGKVAVGTVVGAATAAEKAVVSVGNKIAHVVSYVPIIGGTLAKGIKGAEDLSNVADDAENKIIDDAENPIDAVKNAVSTVESGRKMEALVGEGLKTAQRVSGDVSNVANAVAKIDPELAPALSGISAVAGVIAHPSPMGIAKLAIRLAPDSKVAKIAKVGLKVASVIGADGDFVVENGNDVHSSLEAVHRSMRRSYPDALIGYHLFRGDKYIGSVYSDKRGVVEETRAKRERT